jgi:hypothetical protein
LIIRHLHRDPLVITQFESTAGATTKSGKPRKATSAGWLAFHDPENLYAEMKRERRAREHHHAQNLDLTTYNPATRLARYVAGVVQPVRDLVVDHAWEIQSLKRTVVLLGDENRRQLAEVNELRAAIAELRQMITAPVAVATLVPQEPAEPPKASTLMESLARTPSGRAILEGMARRPKPVAGEEVVDPHTHTDTAAVIAPMPSPAPENTGAPCNREALEGPLGPTEADKPSLNEPMKERMLRMITERGAERHIEPPRISNPEPSEPPILISGQDRPDGQATHLMGNPYSRAMMERIMQPVVLTEQEAAIIRNPFDLDPYDETYISPEQALRDFMNADSDPYGNPLAAFLRADRGL